MDKIKKGSLVKLKDDKLDNYYWSEIPAHLIKHGSTILRMDEYNKKGCEVVDIYEEYFIVKVPTKTSEVDEYRLKNYTQVGFKEEKLLLFKNNKIMDIKEKFILAITKEPQKSFRKAGITNGDDLLTSDGQTIFLTWLLEKHQEEFKKEVVDDILKEEDEK